MKGQNSVLFEFGSIVDKTLSVIEYLRKYIKEYGEIDGFDVSKIGDNLKFRRMFDYNCSLFNACCTSDIFKNNSDAILNALYKRDSDIILFDKDNPPVFTNALNLIKSYISVGNNSIFNIAVRCDTDEEEKCINEINQSIKVERCNRHDINMDLYGRIVCANYKEAMEYNIDSPKSIVLMNFSENFETSNELKTEFIIALGDINEIKVMQAYNL